MPLYARVEAVSLEKITAIDMNIFKLNVEDVDKIGMREASVIYILLKHVSEYPIVGHPNFTMEVLSAFAIFAITGIIRIGIQPG